MSIWPGSPAPAGARVERRRLDIRQGGRGRSATARCGSTAGYSLGVDPVTVFGLAALSFMMLMYALEPRGRRFVLAFAAGCVLSSAYGFLSNAWAFGVVEAVWAVVAVRRAMAR